MKLYWWLKWHLWSKHRPSPWQPYRVKDEVPWSIPCPHCEELFQPRDEVFMRTKPTPVIVHRNCLFEAIHEQGQKEKRKVTRDNVYHLADRGIAR